MHGPGSSTLSWPSTSASEMRMPTSTTRETLKAPAWSMSGLQGILVTTSSRSYQDDDADLVFLFHNDLWLCPRFGPHMLNLSDE